MKIELIYGLKNKIKNCHVRWYISSQLIWIGEETDYDELEERYTNSYGSFNWLYSGNDTLLFDMESLYFEAGIIKVNEPIEIIPDKKSLPNIFEGNIRISETKKFNYNFVGNTIYYSNEDMLVCCEEYNNQNNNIIHFGLTEDFSFDIIDNKLVGWCLKNASMHILPDEMNYINNNHENAEVDKIILTKYLYLIEIWNADTYDEEKSKESLEELYKYAKETNSFVSRAIEESISNILDYM